MSEEIADRPSIRKAKQSQAVRVPITFNHFELTSTHEIFTAVFRNDCGYTHAVALKACLVVNIEVDNQVRCDDGSFISGWWG